MTISKPNGIILWEGPSLIDGAPIVVIATGIKRASRNAKTGANAPSTRYASADEPNQRNAQ